MSFNDLPDLLLSTIATYLQAIDGDEGTKTPLAPYSTISKPWNSASESLTFQNICIRSSRRLGQLREIVVHDRRRAVRNIDLAILLPEYGSDKFSEVETEEEQRKNSWVFTETLQYFASALSQWQKDGKGDGKGAAREGGISLALEAYSASDTKNMPSDAREQRRKADLAGVSRGDIFDSRFESSYLRLLGPVAQIPAIVELTLEGLRRSRLVSAASVATFMTSLPCLRKLNAKLVDRESKNLDLRNTEREDFARSLVRLPPSLTEVKLDYTGVVPSNHAFDPPVIPVLAGIDLFSVNIRTLSQNLVKLTLSSVVLSDGFFWPQPSSEEHSYGNWPALKILEIDHSPVTPSGQWILKRDPADPTENISDTMSYEDLSDFMYPATLPARMHHPHNPFRTTARSSIMDSVYLAAGKAVAEMPKLEKLGISVSNFWRGPALELKYYSDAIHAGSLTWRSYSTTKYEPSNDVVRTWRRSLGNRQGELDVRIVGRENKVGVHLDYPQMVD